MLKKAVTYENFDEQEVTETFFFHLSKTELLEMEVNTDGGLQKQLEKIVAAEDGGQIMTFLKKFLVSSVGKKSPDGSRFLKSDEIREDFESSPAFDKLFMELCTDPEKAAEFLNGIVPKGLAADMEALESKMDAIKNNVEKRGPKPLQAVSDPAAGGNVFEQQPQAGPLAEERAEMKQEQRVLSESEMRAMDPDELRSGLAEGRFILGYKP